MQSLNNKNHINFQNSHNRFSQHDSDSFSVLPVPIKNFTKTKEAKNSPQILKILVVEDEPINQQVAKTLLGSKGYSVDIAPTGQDGLSLYQVNEYAAILMDMDLPDIKGTEVTRKIREFEETNNKQRTPIIALTANGINAKPECLAAGMDDFSHKPFEIEQLNQLIKQWVEK